MTSRTLMFVSAATLLAGQLSAQEKTLTRAELPAAVERTVAAESQGATIRGFAMEKEKGKTYYEVEMTVNGHSKDISMTADGAVSEVEEEVALETLPAAVQAGLHAKAGRGTIGRIESLTKSGTVVAYEAHIRTGAKKSEIQVGPDGGPLAHEE